MSDYVELERRAKEALERTERATERPWSVTQDPGDEWYRYRVYANDGHDVVVNVLPYGNEAPDAEFIAASRQDVPDLAQAVLKLIARVRELEEEW